MKEYEPEVLRKLWTVEEGIYQEFAAICDRHGLAYFAAYGTALGAIRHQGFIPWDDDMDFGMPREDYEKFMAVAPGELSDTFALLEPRTTKGYVMPFAKLTRRDTTFVEETDQDRTYHSGIFIDIFPFDPIYPDAQRRHKVLNRCWWLARLCVLSCYPSPKLPAGLSGPKASLARLACHVAHWGLRLTGQTTRRLYGRYLKTVTQPAREGERDLYADALTYRYEGNYGEEDACYPGNMLFPTCSVPFDGMEIPAPGDYDRYLTMTFGDYWQLPPEDQRHAHFPAVLTFAE